MGCVGRRGAQSTVSGPVGKAHARACACARARRRGSGVRWRTHLFGFKCAWGRTPTRTHTPPSLPPSLTHTVPLPLPLPSLFLLLFIALRSVHSACPGVPDPSEGSLPPLRPLRRQPCDDATTNTTPRCPNCATVPSPPVHAGGGGEGREEGKGSRDRRLPAEGRRRPMANAKPLSNERNAPRGLWCGVACGVQEHPCADRAQHVGIP